MNLVFSDLEQDYIAKTKWITCRTHLVALVGWLEALIVYNVSIDGHIVRILMTLDFGWQ